MDGDASDEQLLSAYRGGDVRAFETLLARYEKPIWSFLRRFVRDAEAAEDLLQEVFLRVVRDAQASGPAWKGEAKFSTWLYTIARNLCIDRARRTAVRGAGSPSMDGSTGGDAETETLHERIAAPGPSTDAVVAGREAGRRIDRAVAELPDDQREVFLMREVMDLPFAEIASVVGVSEPTVKSRMRYALEKLRAALADLGGDAGSGAANQRGQDRTDGPDGDHLPGRFGAHDGAPLRGAGGGRPRRARGARRRVRELPRRAGGVPDDPRRRPPPARRGGAPGARASGDPARGGGRGRAAKQPQPIEARPVPVRPSFWERFRGRWTFPTFATVGAVAVVVLASKVFLEPDKTVELGRQTLRSAPAEAPVTPPAPTAAQPEAQAAANAAPPAEAEKIGRDATAGGCNTRRRTRHRPVRAPRRRRIGITTWPRSRWAPSAGWRRGAASAARGEARRRTRTIHSIH